MRGLSENIDENRRLDVELTETGAEMLRKLRSRYRHDTESDIVSAALRYYYDNPPPYVIPKPDAGKLYRIRLDKFWLADYGNGKPPRWSLYSREAIAFNRRQEAESVMLLIQPNAPAEYKPFVEEMPRR